MYNHIMNSDVDKNKAKNFNKRVFYVLVALVVAPVPVSIVSSIVHFAPMNGEGAGLTLDRLISAMLPIYISLAVAAIAVIIGMVYLIWHKMTWRYYLILLITPAILISFTFINSISSRVRDQQGLESFKKQIAIEKSYSDTCGSLGGIADRSESARRSWQNDISSEIADRYADQILETEHLESKHQLEAKDLYDSVCSDKSKLSQQDTTVIRKFLNSSREFNNDIYNNHKAIVLDADTIYKLDTIIQLEDAGDDPYQSGELPIWKIRNYEARCSYPDHQPGSTNPGRCVLIWSTTMSGKGGISTKEMLRLFTSELSEAKNPIGD